MDRPQEPDAAAPENGAANDSAADDAARRAASDGARMDAMAVARRAPKQRRHHPIVRITHWLTFPLIFCMIASGLQIYRAYPRFGDRGGPFYPNPLQDAAFPEWSRLGGWLAGGLNWHFLLMWPLIITGITYFVYIIASGEWKQLVFRPRDIPAAFEMAKYYLRIRRDHPPQGKHNALQKQAYTFIVFLGMVSVVTGFAVWKPVQLPWLVTVLGGYQLARYWHFLAVWLFVGFTLVHVTLVFLADPASFRAMTTGGYRSRFAGAQDAAPNVEKH